MYEGYAVQTTDGLVFTVKGLVHPPDRVIAYLRYVPDARGDREREGVRYRRVYQFEEQRRILRAHSPEYLYQDPIFGITLQGVPRRFIRTVYDPSRFLTSLSQRGPADLVEEHTLGLTELLQKAAGVPAKSLGVSGSVLIGMHRPDSDIDLIIFGGATGRAVHRALGALFDASSGPLRRPDREALEAIHAEHRPDTPLSFADFVRLQCRKVNEGQFKGRQCFLRFVKRPSEVGERYGDRRFALLGAATIRAKVTDDQDAIFTPCRYAIENASFLDGAAVADLREIVSFRGRFSDQVRLGEWALARGSLERVTLRAGVVYHRLVVGGQAGDYLLSEAPAQTGDLLE